MFVRTNYLSTCRGRPAIRRWWGGRHFVHALLVSAAVFAGCAAHPEPPPCPAVVGSRPIAIAIRDVRDGRLGISHGSGVMAEPGVLWTVAHLLPDARTGSIMIDNMSSGFVQTDWQGLVNLESGRMVGDWAEAELTWLPDPSYGLDKDLLEIAPAVFPDDRVLVRTTQGEFPGTVVDVLDAAEGYGRTSRRWKARAVMVRMDDPDAMKNGGSGSPVLLIEGDTQWFLGLVTGVCEWPVLGGEELIAVTRPACRPCEEPLSSSESSTR